MGAVDRLGFEIAKGRHLARQRRHRGAPVVVFAMAKTGTSAVTDGLRAAGVAPLFQVHDLDPGFLADEEAQYHWSGRPWRNWDAQALQRRSATATNRWRVISLVRDPIAQSISAFFQPGERHGYLGDGSSVESLLARFNDRLDHLPVRWFETHLEPALGIDVYVHDFDPYAGHGVIETPNVELLLLRNEGLTGAGHVVAEFLDLDAPVTLPRANVGSAKRYGSLYQSFVAQLAPSAEALERAYSSRMVRHFYTPEEIDGFRDFWSVGGADSRRVAPIDA